MGPHLVEDVSAEEVLLVLGQLVLGVEVPEAFFDVPHVVPDPVLEVLKPLIALGTSFSGVVWGRGLGNILRNVQCLHLGKIMK